MTDTFWKLITAICLGALLFVIYSISTGKNFFDKVLPGGSVIETASATILKMEKESQLVSTRAYVQGVVRQKDEQVYGNAEVVRIVPATILYAVNLAEVDRNSMEFDDKTQTLWVPLPEVKIVSIDPDLEKAELIKSLDLLRTESGIGNQLEQATEKMVRPALEKMGKSPEILRFAREQAIASVRQLLEATLDAAGKRVKVKPYFKTDGRKGAVEE